MEFRQLENFVVVATNGNLTKAAEILHISQPAVTKSIQLLERDLGVPLFDRVGKRVVLNNCGKRILDDVREILSRCQTIYHKCQIYGLEANPTVTLVATAASELLPEIVGGFHIQFPNLLLKISQNAPWEIDTGVLISSAPRGCDGDTHRTVCQEEIGIALPVSHPLAGQETISLRELSQYPILTLSENNDMRRIADALATEADVMFQSLAECDTPATLRAFLTSGLAPALVPMNTWTSLNQNKIVIRPIRNQRCIRYINIQLLHPERADENVRLLFKYVAEYFEGQKKR